MNTVQVLFENIENNYFTSINPNVTEDEARKYFVGNIFDVGTCLVENLQKCIDIIFIKKD
jgi:hypothetical protein